MDNKYTQNSLKRKNHKNYQAQTQAQEIPKEEEIPREEQPKPDRVDTILDTVETENIARMLKFIIHENELDKFKDKN